MTVGATAAPNLAAPAAAQAGRGSAALLLRLLRERVRPHARRLVLAALFMALAALSTAANAWLLEPAVDQVFIAKSTTMLWLVPLAAIAVAAVKAAAGYAQDVLVGSVGQRIIADTQVALYRHLITADLAYLQGVHSGKLIASFLYDVQLLRETVSRALTGMVQDCLTFLALSAVMFWQDWRLACLTLLVFPPIAFAIRRLGKRMRKASSKTQAETGRLSAHLAETLAGARIVKAYGREEYEIGRAQAAVQRRLSHIMKALRTRSAAAPSTEALGGIAVAIAILYGGWQAQQGGLTLGAFTSFLAALLMAYQPLKSLATLNTAVQEGLAAAERIFALLDTRPTIVEIANAPDLCLTAGELRLSDVGFAYGNGQAALAGVSLAVPAGKVVALVGASGAGKSTILNLIPRFYDVGAGGVAIDGQDVRRVSLRSLRAAIALVAQETQLFDDTVAANIA